MIPERKAIKKSAWFRLLIYILFFGTVAYLAYQLPYCHDDWHWGLPDRLELMKNLFQDYLGRYLGMILIILLTRSTLAKTLIPALWMVWLLWEMNAGYRKHKSFLLMEAILLLALVPQSLFWQSYGWFAAFANFEPPAILFLCWFNRTASVYSNEENGQENVAFSYSLCSNKAGKCVLAFLLALSTQLFSENVTIFALLYALWLLLYVWVSKRKVYFTHLAYFAGTALGAILMFSNGGYRSENSYKTISLSLAGMYQKLSAEIMDYLFTNNRALNLVFAALVVCLLVRRTRKTLPDILSALMVCGFALYSAWLHSNPDWVFLANSTVNNTIELLLCTLYFVSVLFCIWQNVEASYRLAVIVLYFCAALSAAPLMAADPIGSRCFYLNYVLQCAVAIALTECLLKEIKVSLKLPALLLSAAVLVLGLKFVVRFTANGATDRERQQRIEEAVETGAEEVVLPLMPAPTYCYVTEPMNEDWMVYFKEFYGIPQEMTVTFE